MENAVKEISERLAKKGHNIEVFTSDVCCEKGRLKSTKNLKIHYLKSFEFAHTPIIFSLFFRLISISRNSIIHLHIGPPFTPEIVWLTSKIRKFPYIAHTYIDVGQSGKLGFLLPLYKKMVLKKVLTNAKKVICITEEYKNFMSEMYKIEKNKISTIPNGTSKEFFMKKKNNLHNRITLLFVGRLAIQKNIPRLINAVSLLKEKVTLHIVGEGEKRREIEKLIFDKRLNNVILHGKKTGKDLLRFYKIADIFVLPSDVEAIPLVLVEAMASGTPIIASDILGVREFVGDTGVLVNPPTPENFAKAIEDLIDDKNLRKKLSEKGKRKAKQYNWDEIVEKFENAYREVLDETNKE
jgi:rhamnosyl/mannosyltransferase